MTNIYHTFYKLLPRPDGTNPVHLHVRMSEPTHTDSPGEERRAVKDAKKIIEDIFDSTHRKCSEEDLLQTGDPPSYAIPVFSFCVAVSWDGENKVASYKRIGFGGHSYLREHPEFSVVAKTGMELYEYMYGVIREREREQRANLGLRPFKCDSISLAHVRKMFDSYCAEEDEKAKLHALEQKRMACPNRTSTGYCSPAKFDCPCYACGKCKEVEK